MAAKGREGLKELLTIIADESDERLPIDARASLIVLAAQLQALHTMISSIERRLTVQHRASEESKRVAKLAEEADISPKWGNSRFDVRCRNQQ